MTNSEKVVTYGGLAVVIWLLYQQRKCACGSSGAGDTGGACVSPSLSPNSNIPGWIQQLAQLNGSRAFSAQCGIWGRC